ncbi:MAG: hypothetical protein Q9218_000541 [Villophora microphyllina]
MQQVLDGAQRAVERQLQTGNRRFLASEVPWRYLSSGLIIVAELEGWDWELLNHTIAGLRYCMFRKGNFEEVYVRGVVDPEALNPEGDWYMSLMKHTSNKPILTLPDDILEKCFNPETRTRLLYQVENDIGAFNFQEILNAAEKDVNSKIVTQGGDYRITAVPWVFRRDGLVLTASYEGWSWQLLKNTILAIRICLFRKGIFTEIDVLDTTDPVALSGQRHLSLKKG